MTDRGGTSLAWTLLANASATLRSNDFCPAPVNEIGGLGACRPWVLI